MTRPKAIWNTLGSMTLAVYLLASTSVLFMAGAVYYHIRPEIFVPLNSSMLFEWIETFGFANLPYTWWFFLLIAVFFLMGINTFLCTLERIMAIIRLRNRRSIRSLLYLLSPHIMHIAFLVIIAGYLALYTLGVNSYNNIYKPGFRRQLPLSSISMEICDPTFSIAPHIMNDFLERLYVSATYTLIFHDGNRTVRKKVGLNNPCLYKGYSIHIEDFNPSRAGSKTNNIWVNFTIRRNIGIPIFMAGIILFAAGVFLYVLSAFTSGLKAATNKEVP
jgi:hypothetical protein